MDLRSKSVSALAVVILALAVLACNLGDRLKPKRVERQCFKSQSTASQQRYLLTSPEGDFSVTLPTGFTTVIPPEPIKPGYEYAGTSYYSYNFPCHCRINFTAIAATGLTDTSDETVFESRRSVVTVYTKPPATVDKEQRPSVQNHSALSLYTTGVNSDGNPEYSRYLFIIAMGRVYELQFVADDKTELDHPEVETYFKSFEFVSALDDAAISKPMPVRPAIGVSYSGGTVVVEVLVDTNGRVKEAKAASGPIFLRSVSEEAARQARFPPAKEERKGILTYKFEGKVAVR